MTQEQYIGAMVGLAVGDALGYPAEFRSREQILREIGPEGITDFIAHKDPRFSRPMIVGPDHPPGTYTDDTQMSVAVAFGLLEAGSKSELDALMGSVGRAFAIWADSDDNNRAPGQTCMTGCANLRRGVPWREAGVADSKGCGSAMRVAPIGLLYAGDHERLLEVARASSLLTHGHPAAVEGAAAAALLVALALEGADGPAMLRAIERSCFGRSPDFDARLSQVAELIDAPPEHALSERGLGEAWVAEEAVASALYCVWRHPDDYAAAVLEAVNTDGDSDSIAAITGSIVGARLGVEAIPQRWVRDVEDAETLQVLGHELWSCRGPVRTVASDVQVHPTATVDEGAHIGAGTRIWHYCHVSAGAHIGRRCVLGQNVFVGNRATIGHGVKIQNNVSVYDAVTLEDEVFCGPSMVFTNVINPRAAIERKDAYRETLVRRGATLGANATILCGHEIGECALIGAGAVVTADVPAYALMLGVPARQRGWACRCGETLPSGQAEGDLAAEANELGCAACGDRYRLIADQDPSLPFGARLQRVTSMGDPR
jgi:UDP-2-acetamido-3-amino-2,3-dideoxy-glucuronate N-acetyltransferase